LLAFKYSNMDLRVAPAAPVIMTFIYSSLLNASSGNSCFTTTAPVFTWLALRSMAAFLFASRWSFASWIRLPKPRLLTGSASA
jgi:hypothetical protein